MRARGLRLHAALAMADDFQALLDAVGCLALRSTAMLSGAEAITDTETESGD